MSFLQNSVLPFLGRLLMSYIFLMSGVGKLMSAAATTGYIASKGLPMPMVAFVLAVILEIGGGLLLLLGLFTRWVAAVLAVFCLVTAYLFHGFADLDSMIQSMKNIAMAGGFLYVLAHGAGGISLDTVMFRRRA